MKFTDRVHLGKRMTDSNGFVSVPAVITKVGIQKYNVSELMRDKNLASSLRGKVGSVNVFRGPDVVFNPLTIDSFKNIPVTIQHPDEVVSPTSAKFVASGHIGSDVDQMDSERLGATIHLHDESAINMSFGSETSAGYDCPVIADSGEYQGIKYDFRFDGAMIGNHLALVPAGRCGSDVAVLDEKTEIEEMDEAQITKLVADQVTAGIAKAVPTAMADALEKADIGKQVTDAIAATDKVKEDAAAEKAKTDAKSDEAKADAAKELSDRVALHTDLKVILNDEEYDTTKADKELMVLAVGETVEDAASKSDEYLLEKVKEIAKSRKDATVITDALVEDEAPIKLKAF